MFRILQVVYLLSEKNIYCIEHFWNSMQETSHGGGLSRKDWVAGRQG